MMQSAHTLQPRSMRVISQNVVWGHFPRCRFHGRQYNFRLARRPQAHGVRRAAGVRAAGPDRLLFFMQRHPPEETSIGPGKRSLDLLPVD